MQFKKTLFSYFFQKNTIFVALKNEEYYVRKTKADIINKLR